MGVASRRRFAILVAGWPGPEVMKRYGGFGEMIEGLLRSGPHETWTSFDVEGGREMPSLEVLKSFDGIVVSGSRHSVYDADEAWINDVSAMLRDAADRKQKVLGICFGAQLLAQTLGGSVTKAPTGWEAGARRVNVNVDALNRLKYVDDTKFFSTSSYDVYELHRDAVVRLPEGAELLGSSPRCENELFAIGDHVLAVQGHPEFQPETLNDLIASRVPHLIPQQDADIAADSLATFSPPSPSDNERTNPLRALCKSFLSSSS